MSKFLKMIVNLFLIAAIAIAVAILVPPLMGINTTIIDSASLDTNLPLGSVTYSEDKAVSELASNDKILKEDADSTYAYIIVDGDAGSGKYSVIDPSRPQADDLAEVTLRNSVSRVILTIPYIGYVMVAMHSTEGLIIIGLVVLFVIILFILSELWKKKDDEDEADDEEPGEDEGDSEDVKDMGVDIEDGSYAFEEPGIKESVRQIVDEASSQGAPEVGQVEDEERPPFKEPEPEEERESRPGDSLKEEEEEEPAEAQGLDEEDSGEAEEDRPDEAYEPDGPDEGETSEDGEGAPGREPYGQEPYPQDDYMEEQDSQEEEPEEGDGESIIPVERLTLEEIVEQVKRSGASPMVRRDPVTGIEIVDLSEIL